MTRFAPPRFIRLLPLPVPALPFLLLSPQPASAQASPSVKLEKAQQHLKKFAVTKDKQGLKKALESICESELIQKAKDMGIGPEFIDRLKSNVWAREK